MSDKRQDYISWDEYFMVVNGIMEVSQEGLLSLVG